MAGGRGSSRSRTAIWEPSSFESISRPRGYLTVDRFTSPEAFGELLERHAASYAELDGRAEALTVDEREIATGEHL